jgi:26S proteasome regulatory subunit N2
VRALFALGFCANGRDWIEPQLGRMFTWLLQIHPQMPKWEFTSQAKPSLFAYVPATKPPTEEKVEKIATAVLSTTAKAKSRAKKAEKEKGGSVEAMDTVCFFINQLIISQDDTPEQPEKPEDNAPDSPVVAVEEKKPEPTSEQVGNMSRITPGQTKFVRFNPDSRYIPVKKGVVSGILLLVDTKPSEAEDLIEYTTPKGAFWIADHGANYKSRCGCWS